MKCRESEWERILKPNVEQKRQKKSIKHWQERHRINPKIVKHREEVYTEPKTCKRLFAPLLQKVLTLNLHVWQISCRRRLSLQCKFDRIRRSCLLQVTLWYDTYVKTSLRMFESQRRTLWTKFSVDAWSRRGQEALSLPHDRLKSTLNYEFQTFEGKIEKKKRSSTCEGRAKKRSKIANFWTWEK